MSQEELVQIQNAKKLENTNVNEPVLVSGVYVHVIRYLAALCSSPSTASAIG